MKNQIKLSPAIPDIKQKLLTDALIHQEHYNTQLLEALPSAIYTCNVSGYITYYNKAAAALWGREPELGKDLWCGSWRIYHPDGSPMLNDECPMAQTLKFGKSIKGKEIIIERPDGKKHYILPHPRPLFDSAGHLTGAINMLVDISKQKRNENALRESEERFRRMANIAPVMIWTCDKFMRFNFFNESWSDYTGRNMQQETGHTWTDLIHAEDLQYCLAGFHTSFVNKEAFYMEFRLRRKDGEYRWISGRGTPLLTPDNKFEGFIGACNDIHHTKLLTNELERMVDERTKDLNDANSTLLKINKELEQFAYTASHDLQEPLRKITTFIDRLREKNQDKFDETSVSYINRIVNSTKRMSKLIEDMLNYSRIINLQEQFVTTDLNNVLNNILNDFELTIEKKNATFNCMQLPVIQAIPLQMNQLFQNLMSNALKFSNDDVSPIINVSCRTLTPEEVTEQNLNQNIINYEIVVQDNGIGFNQSFAENVFMIFRRLNVRQKYEGTGIGLALCSKIVKIHHGQIFANSIENVGTSIHVILPSQII